MSEFQKINTSDFKKYMTFENNLCLICNIPLEHKPAGTRKDGTSYKAFMGCPNWKSHPKSVNTKGYRPQTQNLLPTINQNIVDPNILIVESIDALRADFSKRMDDLAEYLKKKLG